MIYCIILWYITSQVWRYSSGTGAGGSPGRERREGGGQGLEGDKLALRLKITLFGP